MKPSMLPTPAPARPKRQAAIDAMKRIAEEVKANPEYYEGSSDEDSYDGDTPDETEEEEEEESDSDEESDGDFRAEPGP